MSRSNGFTYSCPLQGRNIRLLDVMLGPELSTLEIRLVQKDLDKAKFEAISYVWGAQVTKLVKCNGCWLSIGSNLYDALWERRRRQSSALLWADAICINQDDNQEKTRQVRLMREIYAKADHVIIWIGKEGPKDLEAFQLAKDLYQKCDGDRYDIDLGKYDFEDFDYKSKGVTDPLSDPAWIALFKIISHPWFGRVWVIQELLVAQRPTMWKGALNFDTRTILWTAMQVGRHRNLYNAFNIAMNSPRTSALMARSIATSYFEYKKQGPLPLYDTLSKHSGMGATDLRDRFFALAGVSSGLSLAFVNYEKTFLEIACLVGKMTLLGFPKFYLGPGGVEMLALRQNPGDHRYPIEWLAFHANPQTYRLGIPSWVPDLLSAHSPGLLMTGFYNTLYLQGVRDIPSPQVRFKNRTYCITTKSSQGDWQIPVPDDVDIKGAIFDYVKIVARDRPCLLNADVATKNGQIDILIAIEKVSEYEAKMVYWLSEIRQLADPTLNAKGSIMDGSSFDAFWRTLVYNREPRFSYKSPNQQPTDRLGISFGYWYLWKKLQMARRWQDNFGEHALYSMILEKLAAPFEVAEGRVRYARNFFVSQQGRIGWALFGTQAGDRVCVLYGMRIPVVLRPQGNRWEFIGACYVHGLMDGEVWDLNGLQWDFMGFV